MVRFSARSRFITIKKSYPFVDPLGILVAYRASLAAFLVPFPGTPEASQVAFPVSFPAFSSLPVASQMVAFRAASWAFREEIAFPASLEAFPVASHVVEVPRAFAEDLIFDRAS